MTAREYAHSQQRRSPPAWQPGGFGPTRYHPGRTTYIAATPTVAARCDGPRPERTHRGDFPRPHHPPGRMSWRATVWAIEEPRSGRLSNTALRVLMALADHAHDDGTSAWDSAGNLARRLHVSERSVERAIAALREVDLIRRGDQALMTHRRADRRPVVWDLDLPGSPSSAKALVERADSSVGPWTDGPTENASRADSHQVNGPTAGVGQNTLLPQEPQRARERDAPEGVPASSAVIDLTVFDGPEPVDCPRCRHAHDPSASCRTASIPAPSGWRSRG